MTPALLSAIIFHMNYPGGKGLSYQKFINLMPPHEVYIETHLGGGSVIRNKKPAKKDIGIEVNPDVINKWINTEQFDFDLIQRDSYQYLMTYPFNGKELLYCDPPYLRETRRSQKKIYKYDYTIQQHAAFLELIKSLPCMVMISGYHSELYSNALCDWYVYTFEATIRKKTSTEWVWMNYPPPIQLHDYRYLGDNYRERERLKRKAQRWTKRLQSMPILEQQALMNAMQSVYQEKTYCTDQSRTK